MSEELTSVLSCEARDLPANLRRAEFAARLRIHERTLDRWIAAKRVKAVKVGGTVLLPRAELTRLLGVSDA